MNTTFGSWSRQILVLAGLGLAAILLGGCASWFGPNVVHVGSGLQWDTNQLNQPEATAPTTPANGQGG